MDAEERHRIYWHLALLRVPGIGPVTAGKLLKAFGEPRAIFRQERSSLGKLVPRNVLDSLETYDPEKDDSIWPEVDRIEEEEVTILTPGDPGYPSLLKSIFDPPAILYVKGELHPDDSLAVSIVGTRRPSRYGVDQARRFAQYLVNQGVTVISGMAMGIDGNAQQSAVEAGGRTVAVLGSGVDVVHPKMHRKLYRKILESGAVVSEFPMGTQPLARNFPRRNRIISGMSLGTLVIEGGKKSGSLITARFAVDQGREVFAIPGQIDRKVAAGPNMLIEKGATPALHPSQVTEQLGVPELSKEVRRKARDVAKGLEGAQKVVFDVLEYDPKHVDKIALEAKMAPKNAMGVLSELELRDLVKRNPGMMFSKNV